MRDLVIVFLPRIASHEQIVFHHLSLTMIDDDAVLD
tara:strand:- start:331 stop:438 length:108 start_codon:yes stop_codon:yes gene_type:complete